jgi:hypothetical protein
MPGIDSAEINRRFDHHPPSGEAVNLHQFVRQDAKAFAVSLTSLPECREKSLAFTALEESLFWANAAIAREGAH